MQPKKSCTCQKLAGSKTTILVIEQERQISSKLNELLKSSNLSSSIKLHNSKGLNCIKCHDIYVIENQQFSIEEKIRLVKKIYKSNPKACVFLLNETEEAKAIISNEIQSYIDPIKLGVVFESTISKNDEELSSVIEYISSIENTKKKLICLWQKLETA